MSLLDKLSDSSQWERFYEYKASLAASKHFIKELRCFIDRRRYLPVCERISDGAPFPLPKRSLISKLGSEKKRAVYTYPDDENIVLKLLTHLMIRKYDHIFSEGLYSFRPDKTAGSAIKKLRGIKGINEMYAYKADISDYFNSTDVHVLLPLLENALSDDEALFSFLRSLLLEEYVLERGQQVKLSKGFMAGTPQSSFYANLFLSALDKHFEALHVPYARYSDDLIVFAPTREELDCHIEYIRSFLEDNGLKINEKKEHISLPHEGFDFLGLSLKNGVTDISKVSLTKLKKKMRRKARALRRWCERGDIPPEKGAKAFVRIFERKLFEGGSDNELTWTRWYFPVITTSAGLSCIDRYAQDCIRFIITGKRNKGRFKVTYPDIKALGLKSLVHEYYAQAKMPKQPC